MRADSGRAGGPRNLATAFALPRTNDAGPLLGPADQGKVAASAGAGKTEVKPLLRPVAATPDDDARSPSPAGAGVGVPRQRAGRRYLDSNPMLIADGKYCSL